MELSERKLEILEKIILSYIKNGDPVGSKNIALNMPVSSATVRNEMAYLSDTGFLLQPHTSAGRVPSQRGYRVYVDKILKKRKVSEEEKKYIDSSIDIREGDPEKLLTEAAQTVLRFTSLPSFATFPDGSNARVRAIQFVQLSRRTAMILLMSSTGITKNTVFKCDFDLTPEILRIFFRVFNEKLSGKLIKEITPALIQNIAVSFGEMMLLMSSALRALLDVAQASVQPDIRFAGKTKMFFSSEYTERQALEMINYLEDSKDFARLVFSLPKGTHVLLGNEIGKKEFSDSSIVVSKYNVFADSLGAIGVIGPMRMDYAKAMAGLDYISKIVGDALTNTVREQ